MNSKRVNKRYQCSHCPSNFGTSHHLKRHEQGHTGSQVFHCQTCYKSFNRRDTLSRHVLTHEHVKEYRRLRACGECVKARTKCSKQGPCQRCIKKSLVCQFPNDHGSIEDSSRHSILSNTIDTRHSIYTAYGDAPSPMPSASSDETFLVPSEVSWSTVSELSDSRLTPNIDYDWSQISETSLQYEPTAYGLDQHDFVQSLGFDGNLLPTATPNKAQELDDWMLGMYMESAVPIMNDGLLPDPWQYPDLNAYQDFIPIG